MIIGAYVFGQLLVGVIPLKPSKLMIIAEVLHNRKEKLDNKKMLSCSIGFRFM